jgi:hypothetical protein
MGRRCDELRRVGREPQAPRIFGRKADIMRRDSLHHLTRERVEAAALQVF